MQNSKDKKINKYHKKAFTLGIGGGGGDVDFKE